MSLSPKESPRLEVSDVAQALQTIFTERAEEQAKKTGFIQRILTGSSFVQLLVFGWLNDPEASLTQLTQMGAAVGVTLTNQALEQRFSPESAALLKSLLEEAMGLMLQAEPVALKLLSRFEGVYLLDSSILNPAGSGGQDGPVA